MPDMSVTREIWRVSCPYVMTEASRKANLIDVHLMSPHWSIDLSVVRVVRDAVNRVWLVGSTLPKMATCDPLTLRTCELIPCHIGKGSTVAPDNVGVPVALGDRVWLWIGRSRR